MKKTIVTTTIYNPSLATQRFCKIAEDKGWSFVIVGDTKTPHDAYRALEKTYPSVVYLAPDFQEDQYPDLSKAIGWKSIQRRNIGFVYAYHKEADIVATIDDDNIPYDCWGDNLLINKATEVDLYTHREHMVFDPLSATEHSALWHRGYPIDYVPTKNNIEYRGKTTITPKVQADFWDGDPDIDAICRLAQKPIVKFNHKTPFTSSHYSPFNSQNTFLAREVIPYYAVLPHIGRMDDVWGAYILQHFFPQSVVFNRATVYQDRNKQDLVTNMEKEILGYRKTLKLLQDLEHFREFLPEETRHFWDVYREQF